MLKEANDHEKNELRKQNAQLANEISNLKMIIHNQNTINGNLNQSTPRNQSVQTTADPKVKCDGCGKYITKSNISQHKKLRCKNVLQPDKKTYVQMESEVQIYKTHVNMKQLEIDKLQCMLRTLVH